MFDRFTDRARRMMNLTRQEAQRLNHDYIGTEHLLLGLLTEGKGVAANTLLNLNVDLWLLRHNVERRISIGAPKAGRGPLPFTPHGKRVLEISAEEANDFGHNYIGTEHILLGLIGVTEGIASQTLRDAGLNAEKIREEIINILGSAPPTRTPPPPRIFQTVPPATPAMPEAETMPLWAKIALVLSALIVLSFIIYRVLKGNSPEPEKTPPKEDAAYCESMSSSNILDIEYAEKGIAIVLDLDMVPERDRAKTEGIVRRMLESNTIYAGNPAKWENKVFVTLKNRRREVLGEGCYMKNDGWEFKWE